ncbi:hypothetical protein QUF72_21715 [Desulfobacterales bacterium HSG2]|nr:hypothetical protein [Desulfobacterales bacterium HSG2]
MPISSETIIQIPVVYVKEKENMGVSHHVIPVKLKGDHFSTSAAVDSGSKLKKCPIFSVLPGMTGEVGHTRKY